MNIILIMHEQVQILSLLNKCLHKLKQVILKEFIASLDSEMCNEKW